jgi:hypothetical protein
LRRKRFRYSNYIPRQQLFGRFEMDFDPPRPLSIAARAGSGIGTLKRIHGEGRWQIIDRDQLATYVDAPPRSPDLAYITLVPVILVAGAAALPVVAGAPTLPAGVPALPVVAGATLPAGVPALPVVAGAPALPALVAPVFVVGAVVPVALVAGFTVVPVVVVAASPVPVAAPPWIPPLAGAPVIGRERRRLGLGDSSRPQTCEP